jgi:hypothetical protein
MNLVYYLELTPSQDIFNKFMIKHRIVGNWARIAGLYVLQYLSR